MILLDPPIFSPFKRSAIRWLRRLGILEWFSPSRRVRRRRSSFASRDHTLEYFAAKPLFQDFPKSSLELHIEEGLSPAQNGFQLRIPREREAEIYDSIPDRLPETIYAARALTISPEYFIPPSAMIGTSVFRRASATLSMADI